MQQIVLAEAVYKIQGRLPASHLDGAGHHIKIAIRGKFLIQPDTVLLQTAADGSPGIPAFIFFPAARALGQLSAVLVFSVLSHKNSLPEIALLKGYCAGQGIFYTCCFSAFMLK